MCIRTPAAEAGAGDFRTFHRQDEQNFLFLPPDHDIIFLHGGFIKSFVPDFEALALIKIYCLRVFWYTFRQSPGFSLFKSTFDVLSVQPDDALHFPGVFIDIDLCLRQQFSHRGKIALPAFGGKKALKDLCSAGDRRLCPDRLDLISES